jgi:hypothetical protein
MTEVYKWIEHPGSGGKMVGHPGELLCYKCKQCGTKVKRGEERREKQLKQNFQGERYSN